MRRPWQSGMNGHSDVTGRTCPPPTIMVKNRKQQQQKSDETPPPSEHLEISEEEQWRLINESGILGQIPLQKPPKYTVVNEVPSLQAQEEEEEDDNPLANEIFNAILYIIPFSFCLLMMEMYASSGR